MPEVTAPYEPGTPCWIDLTVPNQQAALDFYRDLFGWQGEVGPQEFGGYSMCTLAGKPVAGIMQAMSTGSAALPPPHWTTYFCVTDAGAAQSAVEANGGTVLASTAQVGSLGRMMIAADPQGAVFGVWQPGEFGGAQIVNEPCALVWNHLTTSDPEAAGRFYHAVLGLESAPMPDMPGMSNFQVEGRVVGGLQGMAGVPQEVRPNWMVNFGVDDTDSTLDALVRAGGSVRMPAFDLDKVGRIAVVQDPQGSVFSIVALATPPQD